MTVSGSERFFRTLQNELTPNQAKVTAQHTVTATLANSHLTGVIFAVFLETGAGEAKRHHQEDDSGHLQP